MGATEGSLMNVDRLRTKRVDGQNMYIGNILMDKIIIKFDDKKLFELNAQEPRNNHCGFSCYGFNYKENVLCLFQN